MGHEFSGTVEEIGDGVADREIGDDVVASDTSVTTTPSSRWFRTVWSTSPRSSPDASNSTI
ncbi:NADPH:quinone reductase-like Zn-dependent oxidoreductase [Rhodococcus sp. 27YEA15]